MADDLIGALDAGAKKLLEMAMAPAKDEDGTPTLVTLAERVKAFDSVAEWAKTRDALVPKEIKESKFDVIRRDFSGASTKRGRVAGKKPEAEGGSALPDANGSGGASALFDA